MACSACGSDSAIVCSLSDEYRDYAPADAAVISICTHCLTVDPADATSVDTGREVEPDFSRLSDSVPTRPERAIPLVLAIDLCSSIATNRSAIESLLEEVERAGTDPLLVIDRLRADPDVEPAVDLERRRHQLEQLLY
ncbi:hypothetical protein CV102_11695 [Natronococcus pandeyae]|uniref:Small CPxCG-related zinc finger protein n=1 Tax=Natronococcus pandeyae TaxID=2055836 RepID=A0A8J8Q732_9EURY|nr:DUF6276 family protein [Natronococcus pandeyae]TYL38460.1 hypothetical protein CV102_11695 [Natronococcus pandeyae]